MPRNIDHRVEVLFPIRDRKMIRHIYDEVLPVYFSDNVKARRMLANGSYQRKRGDDRFRIVAQEWLLESRRESDSKRRPPHRRRHPGRPGKPIEGVPGRFLNDYALTLLRASEAVRSHSRTLPIT